MGTTAQSGGSVMACASICMSAALVHLPRWFSQLAPGWFTSTWVGWNWLWRRLMSLSGVGDALKGMIEMGAMLENGDMAAGSSSFGVVRGNLV